MGSYNQVEHTRIEDIGFRIYSEDEIRQISLVEVTSDESFNELGHIIPSGLYDLRMGPMAGRNKDVCQTCGKNNLRCQGHCGHIELPLPVYNPFFYNVLNKTLRGLCYSCHRIQVRAHHVLLLKHQMELLDAGYGYEALELENILSRSVTNPIEATEVSVGVNDKVSQDAGIVADLLNLKRTLSTYCDKVIKGGTCSPETSTSIIKNLEDEVVRSFIKKCYYKDHKRCVFCHEPIVRLTLQNSRFIRSVYKKDKDKDGQTEEVEAEKEQRREEEENEEEKSNTILDAQSYITSEQARDILRKCWHKNQEVLSALYPVLAASELEHPTDIFFLNTLMVVPPKFRPCNYREGVTIEHQHTVILRNVVRLSKVLRFLLSLVNGTVRDLPEALQYMIAEVAGSTYVEKIQTVWYQLQNYVDAQYDAELTRLVKSTTKGMRQIIEKKEGLFRHNLMGKRVNFSARSVAAPDPMLAVDEVGVPKDFAVRLYYPVPVTQWNVEYLRRLVQNGPLVYPGAVMVEDEEGHRKHLSPDDPKQREAMAKKLLTPPESHVRCVNAHKIVFRHLQNGDFVLMNRQPTLHRPSIQAHRARVMPNDRVFRMPYANCKAYNADFDGDELNMHFPQNELARSEAQCLVTTHAQYLTPKDGSPLAGLIQDCVVASVMLTIRGKFFDRKDYQQLVYSGLSDHTARIKTLPPTILKPQQLWSGKQVMSTLLLNIIPEHKARPSFSFRTSVKVDMWQTDEQRPWRGGGSAEHRREAMTDSDFVMRDGELLSGVIDKSAIGSTSHGLVHVCYELYGGAIASKVLTAINRLCVYYLKWCGHTISVKEFVTPKSVSEWRRNALGNLVERTPFGVSLKLDVVEADLRDYYERCHMSGNEKDMASIDAAYTAVLGGTTSTVTGQNEKQLLRRGLDNHMRMMVDTGAKGSKVNMNQMASLFGSVAIDGKRMPLSITGKSLPSFKAYEVNPRAGGYIPDRFMTGINPKSYYFLCIVGRDSLQHTAVKTADSGYLQRCLIKHLEGIQVKYDMTVRNSDGLVLQFAYGEDGLDVTKVPFLKTLATMDVLVQNSHRLMEPRALTLAKSTGQHEKVEMYRKKMSKYIKKGPKQRGVRWSGFLKFCSKVEEQKHIPGYTVGRSNASLQLQSLWHCLRPEERDKYRKKTAKGLDPINSVFSIASNLGVVSEALDAMVDKYYEQVHVPQTPTTHVLSKQEVATAVHMKALNSIVNPGEAVGALCAQALGEPLTQMTLNTFHFAGRDELNVTLGVPRMKEVLRTASKNISTPIMEVPFLDHVTKSRAEALRIKLSEVSLSKVLESMTITTGLHQKETGKLKHRTTLRLTFLPHREYRFVYTVTPSQVLAYVEKEFIPKVIMKDIHNAFKYKQILCDSYKKRASRKTVSEEGEGRDATEDAPETRNKVTFGVSDDENEEEEDEERAAGDGDVATSSWSKKQEEQDYSEPEEEEDREEDGLSDDEGAEGKKKDAMAEDEGFGEEVEETEEVEENGMPGPNLHFSNKRRKDKVSPEEARQRQEVLMEKDSWIVDYNFDMKGELWCEVTLDMPVSRGVCDLHSIVRAAAGRSLIHYVRGIRRVFVVEKDKRLVLRTEGVNILKMFEFEHLLDVNHLYTNNIHQVAQMYGIEAAQRSIIRELRAVQSAYDIKVDFRHLTLLADYFTCEGVYKACSRQAMASSISPIQKMSFETCTQFLKSAVLRGEKDRMESPSASIAFGQPIRLGTNAMQLLQTVKVAGP
ncbi:DNA-directed RNA polymerase I subunit RPA1-like isoform X2 [Portunus trituberculatus]|uniref:DNA-directed RNA polymerase I subunit RPA1-like isoform X2 n=1 Tax=Portunus trituberculatus TaxID=210409 RepID=UPI001E1CFE1D|nr:DNA-directed RNA polymerase I subunit RPA1-like isoform X2 [Portunus trituberculatus]